MIFPSSHWLRVLLHLCAIGLFTVSLVSGLRLAVDGERFLVELWVRVAPQGDVISWHLIAGTGWVVLAMMALGVVRKRNWTSDSRKSAGFTIRAIYLALPVLLITGIFTYFGVNDSGWVLSLHYWLAMALSTVVLTHILEQLLVNRARFLPAVFIPLNFPRFHRESFSPGIALLISTGMVIALIWWGSRAGYQELYVSALDGRSRIQIDGAATETAWANAPVATVVTSQGNDYGLSVPVEIKALANPYTVYFLISWPDSAPDYQHLPMIKTKEGWKVVHDGFERDDERSFYEDKLAVMLSTGNGFGGDHSVHLGASPLSGYPASRSGRGLHYTEDGTIRDVWHWKAVRGADMSVLDDDYFGAPEAACAFCPRYKAGYQQDPVEDGGVRHNWEWFRPEEITPLRLPAENDGYEKYLSAMTWYGSYPYEPGVDNAPVGSQLPSVIWMSHYEGDRGDVRGQARWDDGRWTLELARARDTGSPFDIAINDGVFMWVAPFDHAQTRHSYHHRPLRLRLQQ